MSEAMNYVLSVRCPESQPIISFIEAIHEEVRSQQEEVIRAFYSRGEYELCPEYKYLEVAEEKGSEQVVKKDSNTSNRSTFCQWRNCFPVKR